MRTKIARLCAVSLLLLGGAQVAAQPFSHFQCGKFKDTIPKATYTADEFFFGNCIIKVPAKQICTLTFKTNVNPPPPGGGPTTNLVGVAPFFFLCYKQKCPKQSSAEFTFKDQFGTRTLPAGTMVASKLLCVPASPSGAFLDDSSVF